MTKPYDYLIVGAGLFGCVFARRAADAGKRCLVIDRRPQTGGNLYCEDVGGISVHKYGPHIFHTGNPAVWDFVNSIVPFNNFINSPLANYKGRIFNLPFNMNTFFQMWGCATAEEAEKILETQRQAVREELGGRPPENLEQQARLLVGDDIYNILIKEYTMKQWGRPCDKLPSFIIRRLPLRFTYNNNYFDDPFQGIPRGGYNNLTDGLLKGVETRTSCDYFEERDYWDSLAEKTVYTGPLDRYFGYSLGRLDYRSLRFEQEDLPKADFQGCAVVNYTSGDVPYTRIIEHKHFELPEGGAEKIPHTVISREYPAEWKDGMEPFYPVNDSRNEALASGYKEMAARLDNVIFGGRLAEYKYYDMAPVVEKVLSLKP